MKRSVLFVAPALIERTYPGKPMALDYLAAALNKEDWELSTLDVDVVGVEAYIQRLTEQAFDLIGISSMSIQIDQANALACLARELCPSAVIIRGGAHDTYSFRESCETHRSLYDAFIVGDGEEVICEIARSLRHGEFQSQRSNIRGIAFWEGEVKFTGHSHPFGLNRFLPTRMFHDTSYNFGVLGGLKTAQVMAARGCENACFYCSESVSAHGRRELRRSIEHLSEEFAILKREGYKAIYFDDPTFTRERAWVLQLCEEIRRWGFTWGCNTRVDCLDDELIMRMRMSGCEYLFCGLESAVPEVLRALNKTADPGGYLEGALKSYSSLRSNGLPCSAFLIFGGPRAEKISGKYSYLPERYEDIKASLEFAIDSLDPDFLSMNILRLLPGLPLSFAPQFASLRPPGVERIHGGYYDTTWYEQNSKNDLRSRHSIYRAFEGCGSVNPPHMKPERCYEILLLAVDMVNSKNSRKGKHQTKIVVDHRFERFLDERWHRGYRRYKLALLDDIEADSNPVRANSSATLAVAAVR